jgi:hypothetical protein
MALPFGSILESDILQYFSATDFIVLIDRRECVLIELSAAPREPVAISPAEHSNGAD